MNKKIWGWVCVFMPAYHFWSKCKFLLVEVVRMKSFEAPLIEDELTPTRPTAVPVFRLWRLGSGGVCSQPGHTGGQGVTSHELPAADSLVVLPGVTSLQSSCGGECREVLFRRAVVSFRDKWDPGPVVASVWSWKDGGPVIYTLALDWGEIPVGLGPYNLLSPNPGTADLLHC